jgi:uncharacterized protein RhaS with RHS repeats
MKQIGIVLIAVICLFAFILESEARWYSPDMGRFISEDPIGFLGGDTNLYRYVGNNPVNYTDPMGLHFVSINFSRSDLDSGYLTDLPDWLKDLLYDMATDPTSVCAGVGGGGLNFLKSIGKAGSSSNIRILQGTVDDALAFFQQLTQGYKVRPHPNIPGGFLVDVPGGGNIGFRPYSRSVVPTVDVNNVSGLPKQLKIKFSH